MDFMSLFVLIPDSKTFIKGDKRSMHGKVQKMNIALGTKYSNLIDVRENTITKLAQIHDHNGNYEATISLKILLWL